MSILFTVVTVPTAVTLTLSRNLFTSDGHGFLDPRGFVGMGLVGVGVGQYYCTHTKPTPILWVCGYPISKKVALYSILYNVFCQSC